MLANSYKLQITVTFLDSIYLQNYLGKIVVFKCIIKNNIL